MPAELETHPDRNLLELRVHGKISEQDFDRIRSQMVEFIESRPGKVKLLEEVGELDGIDLSIVPKGIEFDAKHLGDFSRCAVVSDKGWIGPVARLASSVIDCKVRTFHPSEREAAQVWLDEGP